MFNEHGKEAVYKVIYTRRDIRTFLSDPIPFEPIMKLLDAAHYAPSVGIYVALESPINFFR